MRLPFSGLGWVCREFLYKVLGKSLQGSYPGLLKGCGGPSKAS